MASGLFERAIEKGKAEGRAEGRAKGRAEGLTEGREEGRAEEARQTCLQVAQTLHPAVASRVVPVIEACSEPLRLRRWTLRASRLSDAEFVTLVTGRPRASVTRSRTSRPSRVWRRSSSGRSAGSRRIPRRTA
jgi:hypothetical protein